MKKKKAGLSLDEVFALSEKDPKWASAYEKAGIEVRGALRFFFRRIALHCAANVLYKLM